MRFIPILTSAAIAVLATPAISQPASFDCQNDPVRVNIPAMPLDRALDRLYKVTRCPISGIALTKGKRSKLVRGTLAPELALRAMVRGTGLDGESIKQGLTVYRRGK